MNCDFTLPDLPEGYYWKISPNDKPYSVRIRIMKSSLLGFDSTVASSYIFLSGVGKCESLQDAVDWGANKCLSQAGFHKPFNEIAQALCGIYPSQSKKQRNDK